MSQKDKTKPFQLVGLSLLAAGFLGGIVLMVTRDFRMAGIFAGSAFVVTILMLAMIVLTMSPQLPPRGENPHDV
ncbi:MAG: hypothetical protein RLZZ587_209 [Actinomycetota bacterium]